MPFKPLTSNRNANTDALAKKPNEPIFKVESIPETVKTTTERIYIIYDDSGSMGANIKDGPNFRKAIELAGEATTDYMKNCAPHVTAVEIKPMNAPTIELSKNLPAMAKAIKAVDATGNTPLYRELGNLIDIQSERKFTRALIFTDGDATDPRYFENRPGLFEQAKALKIPIDLILIQDTDQLGESATHFKALAEASGGTFLICKDGKAFKEKMKYFAPLLRHMLPAIASKES